MAVSDDTAKPSNEEKLFSSYLGISFAVFLGFLPRSSISLICKLQSRNRSLSLKLFQAEEHIRQMQSRRKEDSKANARVVEIFASHRNVWQQEEKKLLQQVEASAEEIAHLRGRIEVLEKSEAMLKSLMEKLQREVDEREEMINFMSRRMEDEDFTVKPEKPCESDECASRSRGCYSTSSEECDDFGDYRSDFSRIGKIGVSEALGPISEECCFAGGNVAHEVAVLYAQQSGFNGDIISPVSKVWTERSSSWQGLNHESLESMYHMKHVVARRESPWKVDGETTGVSSKLKSLEQELLNLERIGKNELSKVPSLMRKQAKRYQALAGKIDDLCRIMQASDPCEPTLSSEFRTQRQTEFLIEAFRLQQRAIETRQKLTALQTEMGKSYFSDELEGQGKLTTRRSLDSITNNFKEIQRNLEIWLARIMGDLEGILARDGASRVREYYIPRYPFVQ